jgi:hypothetical protein
MMQLDWIGGEKPGARFKDVRNTRPSIAEEKAELALRLGDLINKAPPALAAGGSINAVREWRVARAAAAKIAGNSRSSVQELTSAISNMQRFWP